MIEAWYKVAVGLWGVSPSDFWKMSPLELWWLADAKNPNKKDDEKETQKYDDLYALLQSKKLEAAEKTQKGR